MASYSRLIAAEAEQPPACARERVLTWLEPLLNKIKATCEASLITRADVARFRAAETHKASAYYSIIPNFRDRSRLEDSAIQVAIGLRLGLPIATPGVCVCSAELDSLGEHALTCKRGVGRHTHHSAVNDFIKYSLTNRGVAFIREPCRMTHSDGKRSDAATVLPFKAGMHITSDATIIHICASSHLHSTAIEACSVAAAAEAC